MGFIRLKHSKTSRLPWSGGSNWLNPGLVPDSTLWPNGVVPYELDASVTSDGARSATAQAAILDWMTKSELVFVRRTSEPAWIRFRYDPKKNGAQYYPLGNLGRRNDLVSNDFTNWQLIAHELGHGLGFIHEHQRPDRNKSVVADPSKGDEYQIVPTWPGVDVTHGPYDCLSINHYPPDKGLSLKPGGCPRFGWTDGVSAGDVATIRKFYGMPPGRGVLHGGSIVSREPNQLDLFTRSPDGGIWTAWWNQNQAAGKWGGWQRLVNGVGTSVSPVTAVARAKNQLDLFIRGTNNGVYAAAWDGTWGGWWRVGDSELALSAVTAVSRDSSSLDVFVRNDRQQVRHARWEGSWTPWATVRSGLATSDVTVVARQPKLLDVFVRGTDGGVWTAAWNGKWEGWWRIGGQITGLGTNVAAASRTGTSIDVVATDERGRVVTCGWDAGVNGGQWQAWKQIHTGVAALGTSPVVVARRPDHLDAFVIGTDRRVYTASRYGKDASPAWSPWRALFNRKVRVGSQISAVSRSPDRLDVFMVGLDGLTYTAAWQQGVDDNRWRGWWPVAAPS